MSKILIYVLGICTGVVLTFAYAHFSNNSVPGIAGLETGTENTAPATESAGITAPLTSNETVTVEGNPSKTVAVEDNPDKAVTATANSGKTVATKNNPQKTVRSKSLPGKTLFDKPGPCVSSKDFEVQKVLESGDAIAREITRISSGYVFTSDLEVLILDQGGSNFYDNQIIKIPAGKCARQIGSYKYRKYSFEDPKVIPVVAIQ